MTRRIIAVLFGGLSGEHVVSLRSAASIMEAVDRERYEVIPVGITREGRWLTGEGCWEQLWTRHPQERCFPVSLALDPQCPGLLRQESEHGWVFQPVDVVFPVLHGPYGEDGTVQGLLEMAGLPYVGSGVLASAASMDKVIMKFLFQRHGLPVGPFLYFYRRQWEKEAALLAGRIKEELGFPCYVKPANLGSSVGITRVAGERELAGAVEEALLYDEKVVVEANIPGREIECSVLGDTDPRVSRPGEIIPCNAFYDYKAKYLDDASELIIPVELGEKLENEVRDLARKAFLAVEGSGLARVDFFVDTGKGTVMVNEINTIPGFTSISMYPKLWEVSGLSYRELVNRLIELALARFDRRRKLKTAPPE